jgi:hypothetical protein
MKIRRQFFALLLWPMRRLASRKLGSGMHVLLQDVPFAPEDAEVRRSAAGVSQFHVPLLEPTM